jgi:hypothetical protein
MVPSPPSTSINTLPVDASIVPKSMHLIFWLPHPILALDRLILWLRSAYVGLP